MNLVDLVIALPTLIASIVFSARGSKRARMVWLGVLGYFLYDEVIFAFNPLFLVYVSLLSLNTFPLSAGLTSVDVAALRIRFSSHAPIRSVSVYLVVVAMLFFLAWMKDIIPAIVGNTTPTAIARAKVPSNPVYVLDLGFLIPLYVLSAVWLVSRQAWGYLLAGILVVLNALLGLSIVSSSVFQHASDRSVSLADVPMFGIIALVSSIFAIRYLRGLREGL